MQQIKLINMGTFITEINVKSKSPTPNDLKLITNETLGRLYIRVAMHLLHFARNRSYLHVINLNYAKSAI